MAVDRSTAFVLYQPVLHSVALKMVGTLEDAEDIVQDTFEKWLHIDQSKIQNTKAYLIKSVSNNSLQFLNSLRHRLTRNAEEDDEQEQIVDEVQQLSLIHI